MANEQVQQEQEDNIDYEAEAREMGWVEQDKFRGPSEKWVDAKTFYDRGEHIFPILKTSNKRLKSELLTRDQKIATLEATLEASQKAIKALQSSHAENVKAQVEAAKREIREQIKQAREAGDTDTELELQDKLVDLRNAEKTSKETTEVTDTKPDAKLNPEFVAWNKEHPWFGDLSTKENKRRSRELVNIGQDLLEDGTSLAGTEFMDECLRILEEREGTRTPIKTRTAGKVEGGGGSGRTGSPTGFDSLPKEAKDICHDDNDTMVGNKPGQFKTVKEWENYYYQKYMES